MQHVGIDFLFFFFGFFGFFLFVFCGVCLVPFLYRAGGRKRDGGETGSGQFTVLPDIAKRHGGGLPVVYVGVGGAVRVCRRSVPERAEGI